MTNGLPLKPFILFATLINTGALFCRFICWIAQVPHTLGVEFLT